MRVGIDSYSYHRRYGEVRPGEVPAEAAPWPLDPAPVLAHARALGVDDLLLETCYLPPRGRIDARLLTLGTSPVIAFSWGHPWPDGAFHGLAGGHQPEAVKDLMAWVDLCAELAMPMIRITLGSPATRVQEPSVERVGRLIGPLRQVADRAGAVGVCLAIENHGDLTAAELVEVIERADRPGLGVTLDNVNLIRLGDDMVAGARILAPYTRLVQLKDHQPTPDPGVLGGPVCTALGEGCAPLDTVIEVLAEAGFDGPVCVELASLGPEQVDELAMIERSVAWLRERLG